MKKFLKVFDYIATIMFSFFIILSCLFISIIPIASDSSYYMKQYERNGVGPYLSEYSISQLKEVTDSITSYLFKGKESMQVYFNDKPFFSPQAISHMADVKDLFTLGTVLGIISIVVSLILLVYLIYRKEKIRRFRLLSYLTFGVFLIIVAVIGVLSLIDFDSFWTNFHHILFPDIEKFNNAFFPYDDTLINVLTLDFFFDVIIDIILRILSLFLVYFIIVQCLFGKTYKKIKNTYQKLISK